VAKQLGEYDRENMNFVLKYWKLSRDYSRPYFESAQDDYKQVRKYRNQEDYPYVNNVSTPDTFSFCEDASAKIVQSLTATTPFFAVMPRKGANTAIGRQVENVLDAVVMNPDAEFYLNLADTIKSGTHLGTSYLCVEPQFKYDASNNLVWDHMRFRNDDFWDIFPDPSAVRINKYMRFLIHRQVYYIDDLETLAQQGFFLPDRVAKIKKLNQSPPKNWETERTDVLAAIGLQDWRSPEDQEGQVEVLHMYSQGDVISLANRWCVIKDTRKEDKAPLPYALRHCDYRYIQMPHEFFGVSLPWIMRELQEDRNLLRSQRRENIDLILNKILMVRRGGDVDLDTIVFHPGALWLMDQPGQDVTPMELDDVTSSAYQEDEVLGQDMENATGQQRYTRGIAPGQRETAMGIIRLQQAAMARMDQSIKIAEFTLLRSIALRTILCMRRFMPQGEYETINGEQDAGFYQLSESDIKNLYDVIPVGTSVTAVKELKAQQIMQAIQLAMTLPPQLTMQGPTPFAIDYYEHLRAAYETLDLKQVDRMLRLLPPQQPQPMLPPGQPGGGGQPLQQQSAAQLMLPPPPSGGGMMGMLGQ